MVRKKPYSFGTIFPKKFEKGERRPVWLHPAKREGLKNISRRQKSDKNQRQKSETT